MQTSDDNEEGAKSDGKMPSDPSPKPSILNGPIKTVSDTYMAFLPLLDDIVVKGEELKNMIATNQCPNFLEMTPDHWITAIMMELRKSAGNLYDFDKFRKGLVRAAAVIFASILKGDAVFRAQQNPMPLPESILGKDQ